MTTDPAIDFDALSTPRLERMAEAGARVLECYRVLAKSNANVVGEVLRGGGEFYEWEHYPTGDVFDFETNAQYYYHAHPPEDRANQWGPEHGHFHTFLRPKGMPAGIRPAPLADYTPPAGDNDALTHFVAISMNRAGFPVRLFTTNRWVTGETWYDAEAVGRMIDHFVIDQALPSWPVNIWITEMLQLFRPEIERMLLERDAAVEAWTRDHPDENAFEDRKLEVTSLREISVEDQIGRVEATLATR